MASGLPEKMSVTFWCLPALPQEEDRCLQQRDCSGFSPDSLLITTHASWHFNQNDHRPYVGTRWQ